MNQDLEQLDYIEAVTGVMSRITSPEQARIIAIDLWKYYEPQTQYLCNALQQTQHLRQIPRLLQPKK